MSEVGNTANSESTGESKIDSAVDMMLFDAERGVDIRKLFSNHLLESGLSDEQNQHAVEQLSEELDSTDEFIVQNELDEWVRMRTEIEKVNCQWVSTETTQRGLWIRREQGDTLSRWGLSSGQIEKGNQNGGYDGGDGGMPSVLDIPKSNLTDTARIQYVIERGDIHVGELGNDYNGDNRRFRLTLRLLSEYGWDSTLKWFKKHWNTNEDTIINQMENVASNYGHIDTPSSSRSTLDF